MATELVHVRLDASAELLADLVAFYGDRLGFDLEQDRERVVVAVGESVLEFRAGSGTPFYHVALLLPGDRFDAALAWSRQRVELLAADDSDDVVFDFRFWDAQASYFHDPAGNIVELIAHRDTGATGASGPFVPGELVGISEVGLVCDPPVFAEELGRELGLELWDGSVDGERALAFVGAKARTLILCRPGRPWLPTGRPAEAHPIEVVLAGSHEGTVSAGDTTVRTSASTRRVHRGG